MATERKAAPLTIKQITAMQAGKYGEATGLVHRLCSGLLRELSRNADCLDDARRAAERLHEITGVRPEHERVLVVVSPPLGLSGLPAIEVYSDPRVKLKLAFECDRLPTPWNKFKESVAVQQAETLCIPPWIWEVKDER